MHDSEERYPPPLCHPGTCEAVIARIEEWYGFEIPPKKKIMWVYAPAGYGKTAVAGTVSKKLEIRTDLDFNPIGATFFFWRTSPERNSPMRFIITLAYQLAMSIPELTPHIETAVKRNPMILNKALEAQLMKLIVEPFKSLGELDDIPHRLIVVDGLDECINSDQESRVEKQYAEDQEHAQIRVLDLILTLQSHHLPLCFLIFSRPEPWIKQHIESWSFQAVTEMLNLYKVGDHMKDVETFVRNELARIAESLDPQPDDKDEWPGENLVQRLVRRTDGHILYAATAIRHIGIPYEDPRQRLQDLLEWHLHLTPALSHSTSFSSLHELYRQIIRSCPLGNRDAMVEVLEDILAPPDVFESHVGVHRALDILDRISCRMPGRGIKAIRSLHAVIRLVNDQDGSPNHEPEFFYHSSFHEFLRKHPRLLPGVTIDVQKGVRRLLVGCLKSLSSINLNSRLDEEHLKFALSKWAYLWLEWKPFNEPEYSSELTALLAVDLTACFIQELSSNSQFPSSLRLCLEDLYHPTANLIVDGKRFLWSIHTSFVEDAVLHLRSSILGALLHVLDSDYFGRNHQHLLRPDALPAFMAIYMAQLYENRPPGFEIAVQAFRRLQLEQGELYEQLEWGVVCSARGGEGLSLVESMFKLVSRYQSVK
ncbi:hypothetical protein EST38_g6557 [Candolleomyces aberdarensis]|uniref:Nephrocystin 3-like N-terminal domain-containing protein n=1 Tax=Candolleomyces aberdarensis TaxID=2316362 RepID=A0A4Q2DJF1_9AGAR|nr:hypothetical protein EST38_g6557 [Candolleomyces aberdarensis]